MKNIAIIGAGISGLYIANKFKDNKNYNVKIYEKKSQKEIDEGYGVQLSVNSIKLLNNLGFDSLAEDEKFCPNKIDFYEIKNLKKICDLNISEFNLVNSKYTTLKRSKLLNFLINGLEDGVINYNYSVNQIKYDKDLISLIFENGEKKTSDYLIISDGVFSKSKSLISNDKSKTIFDNSIAIRGNISRDYLDNISEKNISLFLGPKFHYVIYPMDKSHNFNFIGILRYKLTSIEQKNHNLFEKNFFIQNIKDKISNKISDIIFKNLQNLKLFPVFVSQNIYKAPKNIFAIGDALFAFPPSFAQGASQSIEGAHELYEDILNNTNNFYDKRLKRIKMINNRSNFNKFAFHLSNPFLILLRNNILKFLTKNKKFLENYLGKIYKN
tara:strand:- start:891 stop:2039 length:1149 start_codon:yes stop_codon:yes gene_type:complete